MTRQGLDHSLAPEPATFQSVEDAAIAVAFRQSASLVLKAEYHWTEERILRLIPALGPGGLSLEPVVGKLGTGGYAILSLAASF